MDEDNILKQISLNSCLWFMFVAYVEGGDRDFTAHHESAQGLLPADPPTAHRPISRQYPVHHRGGGVGVFNIHVSQNALFTLSVEAVFTR